jgi:hypothetical protein
MGRKTAYFFSGYLNVYDSKSALEHLGRHRTFKSGALWSIRDGKGLNLLEDTKENIEILSEGI